MSDQGAPNGPSLFSRSTLLAINLNQIKTRNRVRDLAEVYTHEREVNAMLNLVPDMFPTEDDSGNHDRTFLEPAFMRNFDVSRDSPRAMLCGDGLRLRRFTTSPRQRQPCCTGH